jgi:hypothetical protein
MSGSCFGPDSLEILCKSKQFLGFGIKHNSLHYLGENNKYMFVSLKIVLLFKKMCVSPFKQRMVILKYIQQVCETVFLFF